MKFKYLLNDTFTKNFTKEVEFFDLDEPKVKIVKNFSPKKSYPIGTSKNRATACYFTIANTMRYLQNLLPDRQFKRWQIGDVLKVDPEAGVQFNAYYNRAFLKFFFDRKKTLYFADSSEIVAHELGHAVLDYIKSSLWNLTALEVWSFHEAFADIIAFASITQHEEVIERVLKDTGGNLRKSNIATNIGESVIDHIARSNGWNKRPLGIRDLSEVFVYQDPKTLPKEAPMNQLAAECHSFGRIFAGALYECFVKLFEENKNKDKVLAFKQSRDIVVKTMIDAVSFAPKNHKFYESVAKIMVQLHQGKKQKVFQETFEERKIIPKNKIMMLSDKFIYGKEISLGKVKIVTPYGSNIRNLKISEHIISQQSIKNKLFNLSAEIPSENIYFKEGDKIIDFVEPVFNEALLDAAMCLDFISEKNNFGKSNKKMWKEKSNCIIRNYIE